VRSPIPGEGIIVERLKNKPGASYVRGFVTCFRLVISRDQPETKDGINIKCHTFFFSLPFHPSFLLQVVLQDTSPTFK